MIFSNNSRVGGCAAVPLLIIMKLKKKICTNPAFALYNPMKKWYNVR